jgi:hypothetical protein
LITSELPKLGSPHEPSRYVCTLVVSAVRIVSMIVACMRARWDTLLAECDAITAKLAEDGVEALDQQQGSLARIRGFTKLVRDIATTPSQAISHGWT